MGGNLSLGLTYKDVRDIALDIYRENFSQLSGQAKEIAEIRVEEITERVINKFSTEYPLGLQKANDPSFQIALGAVQKAYVRSGDRDLGDLLIDLLVDQCKEAPRSIREIVLNESLNVAPKLTDTQLALLAVMFLCKHVTPKNVINFDTFGDYLDIHIKPFISKMSKNTTNFQHLQFAGCGAMGVAGSRLAGTLGIAFHGLFLEGFDIQTIESLDISPEVITKFVIPYLNNPDRLQIKSLNKMSLDASFSKENVSELDREKIFSLFQRGKIDDKAVQKLIVNLRPYMEKLFDVWDNSSMPTFLLTTVGFAIAHANIKRQVNGFGGIEIWIDDQL
ncbi:LPO_1073/Vpar_1526 family protein [Undibacterium sp. TC4M20W]|uniref:LPO_1073/Vpar_1526 family protein n=1 Tax=unclassified Undibacterium TaxID=2630295 RepID=UPI003BF2D6B4